MTMRCHNAQRVTGPAYHVLAALLLADGALVDPWELASSLWAYPVPEQSIRQHVMHLRHFGILGIQARRGRGYRLVALPPDEHLEPMLACVPAVKRSAWWQTRLCQTRMTA
jgi:biotin operon repressor